MIGAASIAPVGAPASGPGEAGGVDGTGVSRRACDAPAVAEALGDGWAACDEVAEGVGLAAGTGLAVAVGVGAAVGLEVARADGRAVGRGVDATVGFGVAEARTKIVPFISSGWIWQK